jgi:hypothetical protein
MLELSIVDLISRLKRWCPVAAAGGITIVLNACGGGQQEHVQNLGTDQSTPDAFQGDPRVVVPHAQRTIARTMPQFRRCFERMQASGKISLVLTIDEAGGVAGAEARGPVPREVTQCIESRARRAQFDSPEGGRVARLDVPLAVIRQ